MNRNLSLELDKIIQQNEREGITPSLLLHCCCAPCSSSVLERLCEHLKVTVFFYNPNISPIEEYEHRLCELKRLIAQQPFKNPVSLLEAEYEPERFFTLVKGLEDEPEGGERCKKCFMLRLSETAIAAKKGDFDFFTTTLSVSPLKNAAVLFETASQAAESYGTRTLPSDFKKKDGYKRSVELSKQYGLYRQNYCGCIFSKKRTENSV